MKMADLRVLGLRLRLTLARFGWGNGAVGLLCAGAASAWLWGVPYLHGQAQEQRQALRSAQQAWQTAQRTAPLAAPAPALQRLTYFYDALGAQGYAEQQVKTLFALAAKNGLALNQAEYKLAADKNGRYQTYQILLPLKGDYRIIRQFCQQMLLAVPFASLDEINFKRDAIASSTLEAKLRFTLYLGDREHPAPPGNTIAGGTP